MSRRTRFNPTDANLTQSPRLMAGSGVMVLLAVGCALPACSPEPKERVPPQRSADEVPTPPPFPQTEQGTSVHPTDLPAAPPPEWVKKTAYVEAREGQRVIVASGSGGDAGNHPAVALRTAEEAARGKLEAWLATSEAAGALVQPARIVENRIGVDGRAYVRLEASLR